jgi:membrane protein
MIGWLKTTVWARVRQTVQGFQDDDVGLLAASTAYYALLSMLPLVLILVSVVGIVLRFSTGAQDAQSRLLDLVARNTSANLADHLGVILAQVREKALLGGPLGVALALLAAIGVFTQIDNAFNRILKTRRAQSRGLLAALQNALWHRLRAFLILVGLGLLVLAALVAGTANSAVGSLAADVPFGPLVWRWTGALLSLVLTWLLFTLVYKLLPRARVHWSQAAQGAAVAAALWEISRQVMAALVIGQRYSIYGIVGSILVLMLWVYVAGSILFLGAEYVQVVREGRRSSGRQSDSGTGGQGD